MLCHLTPHLPFAPILGYNHHKQTVIFGCGLLLIETFETFLTAMLGKHPSTIFIDHDSAMAAAIAYVFPNTSHNLCLWHICLNDAKHLSHVIHATDNKFLPDFKKCVYEDRSETYFIENGMNCWSNTTLRITHGWQTYML